MTVVVSGVTVAAMPSPTIASGSRNPIHNDVIGPDRAMSAKPTAVIAGPTISGSRALPHEHNEQEQTEGKIGDKRHIACVAVRSSRPPDHRDKTPMMMVNGRNTAPVSVAEYPCTWIRSNGRRKKAPLSAP